MASRYAVQLGLSALVPGRQATSDVQQPGPQAPARTSSKISAAAWMGAAQAPGLHRWEPTWKVTPAATEPAR